MDIPSVIVKNISNTTHHPEPHAGVVVLKDWLELSIPVLLRIGEGAASNGGRRHVSRLGKKGAVRRALGEIGYASSGLRSPG